jgi:hypothetical protein
LFSTLIGAGKFFIADWYLMEIRTCVRRCREIDTLY